MMLCKALGKVLVERAALCTCSVSLRGPLCTPPVPAGHLPHQDMSGPSFDVHGSAYHITDQKGAILPSIFS